MPREHGAYAELVFPLGTALLAGRPGMVAVSFAVATVALFLLHEPLAVLTGRRGERLRDRLARRARFRGAWLGAVALAAGGTAVLLAPAGVRIAALAPGGCVLALVPLVALGRIKTLPSEVLVAGAFSTMLLPVGIAGDLGWAYAVPAAGAWFVTFVLGTLTVHATKTRIRREAPGRWTIAGAPAAAVAVAAAAVAAWITGILPPLLAGAYLPAPLVVLVVAAVAPHPRHLRRLGWSMVGANVVILALLLAAS